MDMAAIADGSPDAWFVCGRPRYPWEPRLPVVARHHGCRIVLAASGDDADTKHDVALHLGRAKHLSKTDPAVLVKALARYDVLHLVVEGHHRPHDSSENYEYLPKPLGCRSRGIANDFDCRPEAIAPLLAEEGVASIELWNRFWIRWK